MGSKSTYLRVGAGVVAAGVALLVVGIFAFRPSPDDSETPASPRPETPAAVQVADPTTEALARILDPKLSAEKRLSSLGDVKRELTEEEVVQVRDLVRQRKLNLSFRNDILVMLERQKRKPEWLGPELVRMWNDDEEHDTWRDYTLQHMEAAHDYASNRAEIEETLLRIAAKGGRMSGTALLSLERLGKRHSFLGNEAKTIARAAILAEDRDDEAAVTAMQIARAAGDESVLGKAREFAADKSALVRLRMSSIGYLGGMGEAVDLALLEKLSADPEKRVKRVAKYNLQKLRSKYRK